MKKKQLRKKLALMLANLKKKRKYYTEVEYLESTGTQWIDAGINVDTSTDESKLQFELTETQNYKWFFGEYDNNARLGLGSGDGANKRNFLYQQSATKVSDTQMYNKQHLFEINSNGGFLDGTKIRDYANFASTSTIYLFNLNIDSPSDYRCKSKIWKYEHKRNGVLVRDMIPVLDWDMTPCMYDRVTEQLFYNVDTGNFVVGRQIHPVDYLESTGVEYIDTGIKFDGANTKIELKTYEDSLTRIHSICGDDGNFFYYFRGTGNWAVGYKGTAANIDSYMSVGDNVFVIDKNNVYVNGVLAKTYTATSNISSYNALLFNRKTSLVDKGAVTMYYCKIWNNDVLVRDFIPAISEDGTAFMFDKVSHTCFLNQGTGAFKYPAREVEYLEGTGTQYIDTGLDYFADFEVGIQLRTNVSNKALGNGAYYCIQRQNSSSPNWQFTNGSGNFYNSSTRITEHHVMKWKDNKIYSDDVLLTEFTKDLNIPHRMYLYTTGTSNKYPNVIYFCKLWNPADGTLVRDFVPVYKDGVLGMLDKVNNVFYTNAGTGQFLTGKIVEPEYE